MIEMEPIRENRIECREQNNIGIVKIVGDFTTLETKRVIAHTDPLINKAHLVGLILDFSELYRIDSTAIGMMLGWVRLAQHRPFKVLICGARESLVQLWSVVGVDQFLVSYPSVDQALKNFSMAPDPNFTAVDNPLESPELL